MRPGATTGRMSSFLKDEDKKRRVGFTGVAVFVSGSGLLDGYDYVPGVVDQICGNDVAGAFDELEENREVWEMIRAGMNRENPVRFGLFKYLDSVSVRKETLFTDSMRDSIVRSLASEPMERGRIIERVPADETSLVRDSVVDLVET